MIRTTIAAALIALTFASPASAHDTRNELHLGGPDAGIVINGMPIQFEYLPKLALERAGLIDCLWFEDGSASCE